MEDRIIRDPDFSHGANGYQNGCRCQTCREGQRLRIAEQRDKRRRAEAEPKPRAGRVERTVRRELKGLTDRPPWSETLHDLALLTARAIDQAEEAGRVQSLPSLTARLLDVLDRLRPAGPRPVRSGAPVSVGDEAEDFVNGLPKLGGP